MHIRQPFAVLGFSFASVLFLCAWLTIGQIPVVLAVGGCLALIGCLFIWKKKGALLLAVGLMTILAALISLFRLNELWDIRQAAPEKALLNGTVSSGDQDSGFLISDAALSWENKTLSANVLLYGDSDLLLYPGETVSLQISIQDGLPTASQLGRSAQLTARADSASLRILKPCSRFSALRQSVLNYLKRNLHQAIPDAEKSVMMIAVLTGDDSAIPQRVYSLYQRSGAAHILCVSGLHLSILAGLMLTLFSLLGRRPALILSMVLTGLFVWLTGMGASALRAWMMTCLALSAELFFRDAAPVNSLGFAVLILTLRSPFLVCRMGFLLSVASVLAVTAVAPAWQDTLTRFLPLEDHSLICKLAGLLLPSLTVTLVTLPVTLLFLGYVPLLAPLTNMILIPLMPALLVCGLLAGITAWTPFGVICRKIFSLFDLLAHWSADGPTLPLESELIIFCIVCCAVLALLVVLFRGKALARTAAGLLSLLLLCWGGFADQLSRQDLLIITQLAWSDSSSILLQRGNQAVVIGCGGSSFEGRQLTNRLLASGVRELSAVIIPEDRLGCTGGAYDLLVALGAQKVLSPDSNRIAQALSFSRVGEVFPLDNASWNLFGQGELSIRTGKNGPALLLDWAGTRIVLDSAEDPVPWPADFRFLYDKKQEKAHTTRENYAIMVSSGSRNRPEAQLLLATDGTVQ